MKTFNGPYPKLPRIEDGAALMLLLIFVCRAVAQDTARADRSSPDIIQPVLPDLVRPDGKLTHKAFSFTSRAYEREALKLIIQEANSVAKDLQLPEKLPIAETNVSRVFVVGYGMSFLYPKMIGNIHTKDYGYFVSVGHKLSYVEGAHQDEDCLKWMKEYQWPKSKMDSTGAYQLATQWLAAARMDVEGLNRDCKVKTELESFSNRAVGRGKFVPIYFIFWQSRQNLAEGYGDIASVKLLYPTKTLISLRVEDPKYILRPALVFTNLQAMLSEPEEPRK